MSSRFEAPKRLDIHIHLLGSASEGCYISEALLRRPWWRLISRRLGLNVENVGQYVERLASYIRESPIDIGVVLAFDAIYDKHGERDPRTSFYVPNDYALKVARQHRELLAGVSINPNRRDALDELDRCIEAGAVLVKWLPNAQDIDPSDPRHKAFYRKLREGKMPLLSHVGSEFTMRVARQDSGNPQKLRLALEEGTTVIAAHAGVSYGGLSTRYLREWLALVRNYPNLYGDIAALSFGLGGRYVRYLLQDEVARDRLVYGSDFPVPPIRGVRDLFEVGNPFSRDYEIKKRLGVPEEVFYRGYQLIHKG